MKISDAFSFLKLAVLILIMTTQSACKKKDCFNSAGERIKETRNLEAFKQIELYNYFNVYLKSDSVNKIEIEAGGNQIPNIETQVIDGILTIKDLNACGFVKGYADKNLYISVDTLTDVVIKDGANIYSSDTLKVQNLIVLFHSQIGHCDLLVDADQFQLHVWYGGGDYIVGGRAEYSYFYAHSLSFMYAEELETNVCRVLNNSLGNCYVKTDGQLFIKIQDSGDIYYTGAPEIIIEEESGSGKLVKKD